MTQKLIGLFDVLIEQKNTAEKSRLIGVDVIELLNNHIFIYQKGKLIYKVWLKKEDYQELEQALEDIGINIYKVK